MMLKDWHDIHRPRLFEQMRPRLRIELLRLEHRDEVFIPKLVLRSVGHNVVFIFLASLHIHQPRIPLAAKCRHRVNTPVNENSELRVLVPLGNLIGIERLIVRPEWPLMANSLNVA